jgi:hypothetical protein
MGQMATFTPAVKTTRKEPRVKINMNDLKTISHVKLVKQKYPKPAYTKLDGLRCDGNNNKLNILWNVSFHFPKPRPMWSGYMQLIRSDFPHIGKNSDISSSQLLT